MQFSVETVREVAQLMAENDLGEVTLEATGVANPARLTLRRATAAYEADEVTLEDEYEELVSEATTPVEEEPQGVTVTAAAVGVFREAKTPVEVGAVVKKKQLLGVVESLKVPNEVYAPQDGRVTEILVTPGQGVQWGQALFVLAPAEG